MVEGVCGLVAIRLESPCRPKRLKDTSFAPGDDSRCRYKRAFTDEASFTDVGSRNAEFEFLDEVTVLLNQRHRQFTGRVALARPG